MPARLVRRYGRSVAHLCAECGYEYPEADFQATPPEQRRCPECGSERISAQVYAQTAGAVTAVGTVSIRVTANVWLAWMQIAIERARAARQARQDAVQSSSGDGMTREFHAALVAVAASAHALDALYGSTAVPAWVRALWRLTSTSRHAKIRESLKRIFNTGPVDATWAVEFKWLFGLRDAALHAREEPHTPVAPRSGATRRRTTWITRWSLRTGQSIWRCRYCGDA